MSACEWWELVNSVVLSDYRYASKKLITSNATSILFINVELSSMLLLKEGGSQSMDTIGRRHRIRAAIIPKETLKIRCQFKSHRQPSVGIDRFSYLSNERGTSLISS